MDLPVKTNKGAETSAKIQRQAALKRYYDNPNICKYCSSVILVAEGRKVRETRVKQFCTHTCAAKFNNVHRIRTLKPGKVLVDGLIKRQTICTKCGCSFHGPNVGAMRKYCKECGIAAKRLLTTRTKGELFSKYPHWTTPRNLIRGNAVAVFKSSNHPKQCRVCGYDKYIEACHIKSVASFPDNATVGEINDPLNLIGLCPNCHWEYDHNLLDLTYYLDTLATP